MGDFDKAEEIYQILREEISVDDEIQLSYLYQQFGVIRYIKMIMKQR
jgi:hypothetical protein